MKKLCLLLIGLFLHSSLIADYSYNENGNVASIYLSGNGEVHYEYEIWEPGLNKTRVLMRSQQILRK